MKLGLTEKQYNHLLKVISEMELGEQSEPPPSEPETGTSGKQAGGQGYPEVGKWESGVTRGPGNQVGVTKWSDVVGSKLNRGKGNQLKEQSSYEKGIWGRSTKQLDKTNKNLTPVVDFYKQHNHDINLVLGLAFGIFGGPIGMGIATGLGVLDAKQYFDEGDDKTGGMILMFSLIPYAGPTILKLFPGAAKLGSKGMALLAKKISKGVKITDPAEIKIVTDIAKYRPIIEQEMKKIGKELSIKVATQSVRKNITKQAVKKKIGSGVKAIMGYGAAGVGYSTGYDYVLRKKEDEDEKILKQKLGIEN
jgi:hypothetical protein